MKLAEERFKGHISQAASTTEGAVSSRVPAKQQTSSNAEVIS